jgi:hypothetical protein
VPAVLIGLFLFDCVKEIYTTVSTININCRIAYTFNRLALIVS